MLKNKDDFVKALASDFAERYKLCNYNKLDVVLFIRRLNNMGFVVAKTEDIQILKNIDSEIFKDSIIKWNDPKNHPKDKQSKEHIRNRLKKHLQDTFKRK